MELVCKQEMNGHPKNHISHRLSFPSSTQPPKAVLPFTMATESKTAETTIKSVKVHVEGLWGDVGVCWRGGWGRWKRCGRTLVAFGCPVVALLLGSMCVVGRCGRPMMSRSCVTVCVCVCAVGCPFGMGVRPLLQPRHKSGESRPNLSLLSCVGAMSVRSEVSKSFFTPLTCSPSLPPSLQARMIYDSRGNPTGTMLVPLVHCVVCEM